MKTNGLSKREDYGFRQFRLESVDGLGHWDFKKINGLSDAEFERRYRDEMRLSFYEHAESALEIERSMPHVDIPLRPITCSDCSKELTTHLDFVRYYGNSLHGHCFISRLGSDGHLEHDSLTQQYWQRVASLFS